MKNTRCEFTNFSDVLKYIINNDKYGEAVLRNRERTENIINDLVPDLFEKEKKLLNDAYYCNVIRLMLDANSSSEKHDMAFNSAKVKLVKNAGITEESAIEILKDVSSALGWEETVQCSRENSSPTTCPVNQKDSVELSTSAESEIAYYEKVTPQKKKKKRFPIAILLLIAILVCVIWLFSRKQQDYSVVDENIIEKTEYDESENISKAIEVAEIEPQPVIVEETEIEPQPVIVEETEEPGVIVGEEVVDDESSAIATELTESQIDKYTIFEVDSADWEDLHEFITHSVYSPQDNLFYYLNAIDDDLYCYNLETGEKDAILSMQEIKDLCRENWPQSENSQMSLVSSDSEDKYKISVYGLLLNPYNNEIFICGLFSGTGVTDRWWFYNIIDDSFSFEFDLVEDGVISAKNNRVFFVSENEYYYSYRPENTGSKTGAHIYTMGDKTADVDIGYWDEFDYLIDYNDEYYIIYCYADQAYLYNLGTIYSNSPNISSSDSIEIFNNENVYLDECAGFCYYNNYLYIKDEFNDVYVIDIDNLTKDLYISNSDIKENGKVFLGDETCSGLHMTNDGGYITFDSSNKKIKYVKCNN